MEYYVGSKEAEDRVRAYIIQKYYSLSTEPEYTIEELEQRVMKAHPKIPKGYFENHIPEGWFPADYANYLIDNPDCENISKKDLNPEWDEYYWYALSLRCGYHLLTWENRVYKEYLTIKFDDLPEDADSEGYYIRENFKDRLIFKCVNEGRNISRWIIRTIRTMLYERKQIKLVGKFDKDSKYYKNKAKKLTRYLNEWDNTTAEDTLCLTHWLKKKYPGDSIYELLDAFYYFSINNNCCYRHKDEFPYWDDCTKTSCIDKEERLELEDWYNELWEYDY